jgi:hypothetical protein
LIKRIIHAYGLTTHTHAAAAHAAHTHAAHTHAAAAKSTATLAKPTATLTKSTATLTKSTATLAKSTTTLAKSTATLAKPATAALTKSTTTLLAKPTTLLAKPTHATTRCKGYLIKLRDLHPWSVILCELGCALNAPGALLESTTSAYTCLAATRTAPSIKINILVSNLCLNCVI